MSMFSGRIQLKTMDMINTTATIFCAKTDCMIDGKIFQIPLSLAVVNPIPTARERETIVIFLCEKPQEAIICTPDVRIEPNIIMVHPPTTESGSEAKKFPIGGSSPARIIHTAPVIMVKRFTTFVMATSPTFCEKDVTGGHPNREEIVEA